MVQEAYHNNESLLIGRSAQELNLPTGALDGGDPWGIRRLFHVADQAEYEAIKAEREATAHAARTGTPLGADARKHVFDLRAAADQAVKNMQSAAEQARNHQRELRALALTDVEAAAHEAYNELRLKEIEDEMKQLAQEAEDRRAAVRALKRAYPLPAATLAAQRTCDRHEMRLKMRKLGVWH